MEMQHWEPPEADRTYRTGKKRERGHGVVEKS